MDEHLLSQGNLFVAGPDFDTWSGPDLADYLDRESVGTEDEILQSPGYHGVVQGSYSFQRLDPLSNTVTSGIDTTGDGTLYRTKVIFTPTTRLQASTDYTVYLTGDEASGDSLDTGVSSRTVYDTLATIGNTSTVDAVFGESYSGSINDTYHVEITTSGFVGTARFKYWTTSHPTKSVALKTRRGGTLLSNGVTVSFPEGTYVLNDTWTCVVKPHDIFSGNLTWPFLTGTGSIQEIPSTAATSVIGDTVVPPTLTTSSSTFSVESTLPADKATNQTIPADSTYTVTVTFSDNIDPLTVASGVSYSIEATAVDGDSVEHPASGVLQVAHSVSGDTLSLVIPDDRLLDNNLVTITLDSDISSVGGVDLGTDYSFWFTTTYSPYYCTLQKIKLDAGFYLSTVPDDTINMAIFTASEAADALTWNDSNNTDSFYKFVRTQWTCCKAQEILLINVLAGRSNLKSKQLDDFRVEYQPGNNEILDRALSCMAKWEAQLARGGRAVEASAPSMVVKGEWDADRPPIGRRWGYSNGNMIPASNTRIKPTGSRRYKNTYYTPRRGKKRYDP